MNIGIGGVDFPNLKYFGIVGDDGPENLKIGRETVIVSLLIF